MRKLIILCAALMILLSVPGALAIDVDGYQEPGEWNDEWAFNQLGTGYDANGPFGDKMVILQQGLVLDVDPQDDSGTGFDESMATVGPGASGSDIKDIYARYDPVTDTLYGLSTVYGIPGDVDGDGDITTEFPGDQNGTAGPAGTGLGPTEFWSLSISDGTNSISVNIIDNDWIVSCDGCDIAYGDVTAKLTSDQANSVYEISIARVSEAFGGLQPGDSFTVDVIAGSSADIPGEDIAAITFFIPEPDVDIEKSTNGFDADSAPGPELNLGDDVTWGYVVTNTGNIPLANVVVTDDQGEVPALMFGDDGDEILQLEEIWVYEATGTAECGQYENLADVTGNGIFIGIPVADEDPSHYFVDCEPDIDIEKHTNGFDADVGPGPKLNLGDDILWEYIVTNTGKVPLTNVVVTDDKLGVIGVIGDLGVGETETLTATDVVTECPINYENLGTVTGDFDTGDGIVQVSDEDPSHYFCQAPPPVPALTPLGIVGLIGMLGMIGIIGLRRRD